ncbi:alkaline phosphatase [Parvularcula sp. ZS-1/3]|uniref:Alkaline phosphatase n=1 Tax=Parvularcula mediterranea TaxID=2732508 RepID=A0A7Y3RM86_9PROT|nr:alkaline phosphatase [Parvularcula mediterranea]NNU16570.1 alkaline phosphatase [Parvularcula mediterranea]
MDLFAVIGMQAAVELRDWEAEGRDALSAVKDRQPIERPAKNVILFIADGMDVTTSSAARILDGQQKGGMGEENLLTFESLPFTGFSRTYNVNMQVPDSAGTATAMMTGHKTKAGVINVDQTVPRGDCAAAEGKNLPSILEVAQETGRSSGVISTARITHATPATLYASSPDRGWEAAGDVPEGAQGCRDIARQLIDAAESYNLVVALGGGRTNFIPNDMKDPEYENRSGRRKDGLNLINAWEEISRRHKTVFYGSQLDEIGPRDKVLGLFEPSHMMYEHDRVTDEADEPSLAEMTRFAIERLNNDRDGFFLLVEGGRVDHAHHGGNAYRALVDTIAFDEAVEVALEMTDREDTLIIVTADHGHTMAFQGYPHRGNPIMGVVRSVDSEGNPVDLPAQAGDQQPYTTLGYMNGPGAPRPASEDSAQRRPFVEEQEALDPDYKQQALIPHFSETHGGQDVAIYAVGPKAHYLTGVHEQSFIYYVMEDALRKE